MRYVFLNEGKMEVRDEPQLGLERMQELVGGWIEGVWKDRSPLHPEGFVHLIGNDEAALIDLPQNVAFPEVMAVGGVLRGPLLIQGVDNQGDQRDLTDAELARIRIVERHGYWPRLCITEPAE